MPRTKGAKNKPKMPDKVFRALIHFPVGIICGILSIIPVAAVLFFVGFMIYELNEDYHLKDMAWIDIFGFLIGLPIGAIASIFILGFYNA